MNCFKKKKLHNYNIKNNYKFKLYLYIIENQILKYLCNIKIDNSIILKSSNNTKYLLSTKYFKKIRLYNVKQFIKINSNIIEVITIKKNQMNITTYNEKLLLMNELYEKYKDEPCIICLNNILCKNKFKCKYCKNKFLCNECFLKLKESKYDKCPICTIKIK